MLLVPCWVSRSSIHGYGCFCANSIDKGELVWVFNPDIDREIVGTPAHWERMHAYGSNARLGLFILPGDNAAWINFSKVPNLLEAEALEGEYCLRAACDIAACKEITVPLSSDTDAHWKMSHLEGEP